mgnify:CR=1 FL=1
MTARKNVPAEVREVLVAAIQNTALEESKKILENLEKSSKTPEIEVFGAMRALAGDEEEEVLAIIDCGAKTNKLYITEAGFLHKIHRVQAGGSLATKRVAELLSLGFGEAENIKRNFQPGTPQAADIKKAVLSTYERTLQEFKRVLGEYEQLSGVAITRVVLTGGTVAFPEFASFVSYTLDRPVMIADPFSKITYPSFMEDTIREIGPAFSVALGAALRHFE